MPTYELRSQKTGRTYEVDFANPPSDTDIDESINQFDAANPVADEPLIDISDTLKAAGQAVSGITTTAPHAFRQLYSGLDNPWQRSEGYNASQAEMDRLNAETEAANQAAVESGDISTMSRGMRQAGQSIGFSAGAMGAGLLGSSTAGTAGRYVGGLFGPEGVPIGEAVGRGVGAVGAGYGAAYRMAGAQFLDDARKEIDDKFMVKLGRLPNAQEQEEAYNELKPLAEAFGHAEAGPEAIGNLAMAKAGKFIFGLGGKKAVTSLAANALKKVGVGAGGLATELGGETATQVEQNRIEEQKNALLSGQAPPEQGARTVDEYSKALGEVAPATLATMGLMGSVPAAYKAGTIIKGAFTPKPQEAPQVQEAVIAADDALAQAAADPLVPVSETSKAYAEFLATMERGEQSPAETPSDVESRLAAIQSAPSAFYQQLQRGITPQAAIAGQETPLDVEQRLSAIQNEPIATAPVGTPLSEVGTEEAAATIGDSSLDLGNDGGAVLEEAQPEAPRQAPSKTLASPTTVDETPRLKAAIAQKPDGKTSGSRVTDVDANNDFAKNGGWKLHLSVKPENYKAVDEWLHKNHKGQYKLLSGGSPEEGSDFTIYVGHKDAANSLASKMESEIGEFLNPFESGPAKDAKFNAKVGGRFDVSRTGKSKDIPWNFAGMSGVPFDETAMEAINYIGDAPKTREQFASKAAPEIERINKQLAAKYGDRYTGTVTPTTEESLSVETPKTKIEDFSNPDEFYRVVVGDEAFNDIVESGQVRTNAANKNKTGSSLADKLAARPTAFPSFSKGQAAVSYAQDNPNHYIVVTADESIKPSTSGRHSKGKTMFPTDASGKHLPSLDAKKVRVYKHLANGNYELVYDRGNVVSKKQAAKPLANPIVRAHAGDIEERTETENAPRITELVRKAAAINSGKEKGADLGFAPTKSEPTNQADSIDSFVKGMTPMVAKRARNALDESVSSGGMPFQRKELVQNKVAAGAKVEQKVTTDTARIKKLESLIRSMRNTVPFGNPNHPETIAFNAAKDELAAGPKITQRRLVNPDGSFLAESQISKTAMDYAEHLIASQKSQPTKPITPPVETPTNATEGKPMSGDSGSVAGLSVPLTAKVTKVGKSDFPAQHGAAYQVSFNNGSIGFIANKKQSIPTSDPSVFITRPDDYIEDSLGGNDNISVIVDGTSDEGTGMKVHDLPKIILDSWDYSKPPLDNVKSALALFYKKHKSAFQASQYPSAIGTIALSVNYPKGSGKFEGKTLVVTVGDTIALVDGKPIQTLGKVYISPNGDVLGIDPFKFKGVMQAPFTITDATNKSVVIASDGLSKAIQDNPNGTIEEWLNHPETQHKGILQDDVSVIDLRQAKISLAPQSTEKAEKPSATQEIVTRLNSASSRDEAREILSGVKDLLALKEVAKAMNYPTTGIKKDVVNRLVAAVGSRADGKAIRGDNPRILNTPTIVRTPEQQAAFDEERRLENERAKELDVNIPKKKPRTAEEFARDMEAIMAPSQGETPSAKVDLTQNPLVRGDEAPVTRQPFPASSQDTMLPTNPKVEAGVSALQNIISELPVGAQAKYTTEVLSKAAKFFESGNSADLDGLTSIQKTKINEARYRSNAAAEAQEKAERKLYEKKLREEEKENARLEKERAEQEKLTESRRESLDSIIGTPTGVEMNAVSPMDGQESLALVHNSGDVPGVLNAFVGTSKEFLANKQNEKDFPELYKIIKAGRVDEGNFAYGRAFVFTDGIGVNASDRANATKLGITPSVAAVRRVLIHEGLVHRGIYGLPARLQMQILQWVRQNATPQELDALAKDYPQYADWATNPQQMLGLAEEFLAKKVEKMTKFPTSGPLARLVEILKDIWRYITGKDGEPTVKNLRDVVKLLKAGAKAADARLVNGGGIKMSQLRAQGFVTPEMDAEYAKAIADGDVAKQQAMVDSAAKAAGYNVFNVGNGIVYEKGDEPTTVYGPRDNVMSHGGEMGFYFSDSPKVWADYSKPRRAGEKGKINRVSLSLKKPLVFAQENISYDNFKAKMIESGVTLPAIVSSRLDRLVNGGLGKVQPVWFWLHPTHVGAGAEYGSALRDAFVKAGYDGIIHPDSSLIEGGLDEPATSHVVFNPNQIKSADPITRDDNGQVIPLSQRFNAAKADIRESRISYTNPLDAQLASASERMRQMREKVVTQEVEPSLGGLSEAEVVIPTAFRGQTTPFEGKIPKGGLHFSSDEDYARSYMLDGFSNIAGEESSITSGSLLFRNPLDLRGVKTKVQAEASFAKAGIPLSTKVRLYPFTQNEEYKGEKTLREWFAFLDSAIDGFGPDFSPNEALTDHLGEAIRPFVDGIIFDEHGNPKTTSYVIFNSSQFSTRNPESSRAAGSMSPAQVRTEIRKAYDTAIQGSGSVQASLQQVYDTAKEAIPTLTEKQFGEQVQALYEDGSAFLVPTDRSSDMLAAGEKWGVYDVAGLPASYLGVMPSQETNYENDIRANTTSLRPRGTMEPRGGTEKYGATTPQLSPKDKSPRANTLRAVVDERVWRNLSPDQKKNALDDFGAKRLEGIAANSKLVSSSYRIAKAPSDHAFAALLPETNAERLVVEINPSIDPKHPILQKSALEAHAFMYDMMQEEMIHFAQHYNAWQQWVKSGAKGSVVAFENKHFNDQINELMAQRNAAIQNGDSNAARKIDTALIHAWNLYDPSRQVSTLDQLGNALGDAKVRMPEFMMEVTRQLVQIGRQDFTTETGWAKFRDMLVKWANDVLNSLRNTLASVRSGEFGQLLKDEVANIERIVNQIETGDGVLPSQESPIVKATPIDQNALKSIIDKAASKPISDDSIKSFIRDTVALHGALSKVRMARFDPNAPLQVMPHENGELVMGLGEGQARQIIRDSGSSEAGFRYIADAIEEEIIHLADYLAIRSKWESQGSKGNFIVFAQRETQRLTKDLQDVAKTLSDSDKEALRKTLGATVASYHDKSEIANASLEQLIQLSANTSAPMFAHSELIRSLIQAKRSGEITATGYKRIANTLVKWLQDALNWLKQAYGQSRSGGFGNVLAQRIQDTEQQLEMLGVMPTEIKASKAQKDVDTAIHSARGITGKVDKIVNGLPANSYTGKPLQDAMSQSFAPLGSQKFYDETKSLIVAAIDDMVKRGIDSGDILATVIQPDFTEEAMKGWNESAKSVAKSIYFNHGLLLAIQKQEQLMNDGDITAANNQQDKIDAWSKFWFNLTNNFGVTGNAIQRAMEDPAYQGLYLLTNFAAQTQKGQKEVTDSNVANPNEVAKDINDAGAKSKDDADSDVADALTGIQFEDEIAAGEAALTPENRTLWERAKAILRSLARIAKAETFFAAKGIKASNAAESADEEVARYIQMGPKGVGVLKAKLQKEFGSIVAKLTGTEKTATPRKPRTPKEEAVHPLIARMIARTAAKLNAGTNLDAALADLMPEAPSYRDRIVDDVVSGIVGRANRSIKKPVAPKTLADLTKQLKRILSENIKVEPKTIPEESLGKKALRAFGYVASNEQIVEDAWNKARNKVQETLQEENKDATPEEIETLLNSLMSEVPKQLYSSSQARSIIRESLEGGKFDNSKEILDDVNGARDAVLKSIEDAVKQEKAANPDQFQHDPSYEKSYILNEFNALVADLQKARDAGIAASNKAVRDAVFGADAQKALKIIVRKLTAVRPGIDAPLAPALAWKRLFEMTQTDQGQIKGRMFDIVKDEPAFADLDNADKQKLADILEKAWDARRAQVLEKEFDRLRIKHRNRMTKKAAKVFDKRPAILRKIDSGVFDYDDLAVLVGEEFGIKPLTAAENKRAKEISARLSEDISPHERTKLQNELQEMMVNKNLSLGEMLKAWWISAVLTGPRTAFTIGWSFLSGGYELMGHAATVLLNPKMSMAEKGAAIGDSIKNWWSSIGPELRSAYMYVLTGDKTLQDPAALMQSAFFDNQFRKEMGRFSFSVAEKMIASKNQLVRYAGWFMTYGSRILNALDAFNFNITKAGSAPLVYSMLNNSYQAGSFQTSKLFKEARKKIIANEYGGTEPADTSRLNSWARNAAYQELSKITALAENMNQVARQSNFTLEPTGLGGWLYSGLKFADAFVQKKSEAFVVRMKQDLLQNGGSAFSKIMVGVAELIQAGAMQTLPILGLQFAKFALNKLNQTISFIPVAGLIRTKESSVEGQRVHTAMIWRNQAVGTMLFSFVYFTLKAIEDEPDDEKRGWGIEGGWSNLTPQEKRQRDAAGLKEHTIWWRGKDGKRTVANFMNWPISPILAAAGAMSDQIKYSPDQWAQGGVLKRGVTMGWAMGKSVSETSALSQFTELFGSSMASRDPVEAFANKAARVFGGYAGGYIPRIFKDIDRNMQPEIRKYEGWEYLGKELPYYRRYIGKEYLDIFGNVIAPSQTPWSREFVHQPASPEYEMLSRVNSHGVWLSPAVAENRLVGKGSHKREMTDDEANRYVKIVGKGYSDLILKYGERIISMPKDKAKKFVAEKADDIRDKATKRAIKQPLTSG